MIQTIQLPFFLNAGDATDLAAVFRRSRTQPEGMHDFQFVAACVASLGDNFQSQLKPINAQTQNETHA